MERIRPKRIVRMDEHRVYSPVFSIFFTSTYLARFFRTPHRDDVFMCIREVRRDDIRYLGT